MNTTLKKIVSSMAASATVVSIVPSFSTALTSHAADNKVPEGFVYTKGTQFMCDGSPYYYGGTNCYYLTYKPDIATDYVLDDCVDMGLNVIRIWGNLDAGTITDRINEEDNCPFFENSVDGKGQKDGIYFQYFDKEKNRPVVNEGANGLRKLDYVIAQAEKRNLKLIITFTNYWKDFGGMEQYVKWATEAGKPTANANVDDFYTDETVKGWYKDYIKTLLNHENYYTGEKLMDSEAVFAWELANEPRCEKADSYCKNDILYKWAKEMSEYVKSVDPNHMVCVGDEGFFNFDRESEYMKTQIDTDYAFSGNPGVDFEKLMTIDTIDFGTPHFYCDSWSFKFTEDDAQKPANNNGYDDDMDWLKKHAEVAQEANKPVILEEFGLKKGEFGKIRDDKYKKWLDLMTGVTFDGKYEYQGFNYWMLSSYMGNGDFYPDYDTYTIYGPKEIEDKNVIGCEPMRNGKSDLPTEEQLVGKTAPKARDYIIEAAAAMNAKNICNVISPEISNFDRANPKDIVVEAQMKLGEPKTVYFNGNEMKSGDFAIDGNKITIKGSFLKDQPLADYELQLIATDGNSPKFTISVDDSSITPVTADKTEFEVDKNIKKCKDININLKLNDNKFVTVRNNDRNEALAEGKDYTISGDTLTIKKEYLTKLEEGEVSLILDFDPAKDIIIKLSVSDTTGDDEFDAFNSYADTDELKAAYAKNPNGGLFEMKLVDWNGSNAAEITFDGYGQGYAGATKKLKKNDFSAYKGVTFQIKGDGTVQHITLQFKGNDEYYEAYLDLGATSDQEGHISLSADKQETVFIPFENLVPKSKNGSKVNPASIFEFSIYAGQAANETGTFTIDNVYAANAAYDPSEQPDDSSSVPDSSSETESSSIPDSSSTPDSSSEAESSSTPDSSSEIIVPEKKKGDVDGNGTIDSADALEILKYVVGIVTDLDLSVADVDGNGVINTLDALQVLKYVVGLVKF